MSEKYKLGLTRNRLFEFDNCVLLCAKLEIDYDDTVLDKAFKTLCLKEPLISSKIELEDDGTAYVLTQSVETKLIRFSKTASTILDIYEKNGINFWERLFEFSLSNDGCLIIAGHTAVCDAKSLLRLAVELAEVCNKTTVGVDVSEINLFPEMVDLPIEVASPIVDRLSVELDSQWSEKTEKYSVDDYKKAFSVYSEKNVSRGELREVIGSDVLCGLEAYCVKNGVDVSSLVAFAYYETLVKYLGVNKKYNKMNIYADTRFFFENYKDYGVGAFNGIITADLNKKENSTTLDERIKQFHLDCYKGSTSPFRVFYDDVFFMKLSPALCDASYMYSVGLTKNKAAKKLAENYGCTCEKICDFFSCNLQQQFWRVLENYVSLDVFEPFKMRSSTYVGFIRRKGEGYITFKYKKDKCSDSQAEKIMKEATELLQTLSKTE